MVFVPFPNLTFVQRGAKARLRSMIVLASLGLARAAKVGKGPEVFKASGRRPRLRRPGLLGTLAGAAGCPSDLRVSVWREP